MEISRKKRTDSLNIYGLNVSCAKLHKYIYDYAMAHDLEPVKIVRIGEFLLVLRVRLLEKCVEAMQNEITTGILVSNMCNLTEKLS